MLIIKGNDHLTEIQLIKIVFFQLIKTFNNELIQIWSLDRISLDIFSWSNFLIKRLKISQLIEILK